MTDLMRVFVSGRRHGKTTAAIDWLLAGHRIYTYPGWSRILVCASESALHDVVLRRGLPHPASKCVFTIEELHSAARGAIVPGTVEYAVDDLDVLMMRLLPMEVGRPALITVTGQPLEAAGNDS